MIIDYVTHPSFSNVEQQRLSDIVILSDSKQIGMENDFSVIHQCLISIHWRCFKNIHVQSVYLRTSHPCNFFIYLLIFMNFFLLGRSCENYNGQLRAFFVQKLEKYYQRFSFWKKFQLMHQFPQYQYTFGLPVKLANLVCLQNPWSHFKTIKIRLDVDAVINT